MKDRREIGDAIYGDCLPSGEWVYSRWARSVISSWGDLGMAPTMNAAMECRMIKVGPLPRVIAKSHNTGLAWVWDGRWDSTDQISHGVQGHSFWPDGRPAVLVAGGAQESQGLRYYDATAPADIANQDLSRQTVGFVTGSPTYSPATLLANHYGITRLWEWTKLGDIAVGQGENSGTVIQYGNRHYLLEPGESRFVQAHREGDQLAIAISRISTNVVVFHWLTVSDILALPVYMPTPPPITEPIGPRTPSRSADGRKYDIIRFMIGDANLWPRKGPSHEMNQVLDTNGRIHFVKFANLDRLGKSYETWCIKNGWALHLEDASGRNPYSWTDQRWFPQFMPIGRKYLFDTGRHQRVEYNRETKQEVTREPFRRKMWLHALYDEYYWGPEIGIRPTIVLVYDPTDGIHEEGRGIELYFFALGAGWVQWEYHRSDLVYKDGDANFTEETLKSRSSFYELGGLNIGPRLSGVAPTEGKTYPPIEQPLPPEVDNLNKPEVTVLNWTLDELNDGEEFVFEDTNNPTLGYKVKVFVENGSLHARITNVIGSAQTGLRRPVRPSNPEPDPEPDPQPDPLPPPPGDTTTVLTAHSTYWHVNTGGVLQHRPDSDQEFKLEPLGNGQVAIKAPNGKYLCAENGGANDTVVANRDSVGAWETFTMRKVDSPRRVSFEAANGHIMAAETDGRITVNRTDIGSWETFEVSVGTGGSLPFKGGRVRVDNDVFRHEDGSLFSWRGATMFLLFRRFLLGQDISAQIAWMHQQDINVARVLGMVSWPEHAFGPNDAGYWDRLPAFAQLMLDNNLRIEFVVFADAQIGMPDEGEQRRHLRRVIDTLRPFPNVFVEICNEPFKNGVDTHDVFSRSDERPFPMAFGDYEFEEGEDGRWYLPGGPLDYLTIHTGRDEDAWMRKAKDTLEGRQGEGVPTVSDEPMGAAESYQPGRRSDRPEEHFWHHAVATLMGNGSTFHSDAGLYADVPPQGGRQQACVDATSLAWRSVPIEFQQGQYTRGGLANSPLAWDERFFPVGSSRIYGMILGNRACCVAVKPMPGWTPVAVNGWRIVSVAGPQDSLVILER